MAIDEAISIVRRTFRSRDARAELVRRIHDIGSFEPRDDPFEIFYLACLSLVQSGQRNQSHVRPVRRWFVRHGYATQAGEWDVPEFQHDGRQWVVRNHPVNLGAIR